MWTNELELTFLECYKNEAVLWDPRKKSHKDRSKLNEAWYRISELMDIPPDDLKKKKDSLMATYRTHCRRLKASLQSGASSEEIYKPIWFAFDFMNSFLWERNDNGTKNTIVCPPRKAPAVPTWRRKNPPEDAGKSMRGALSSLNNDLSKNQKQEDECDWFCKLLATKLRKLPEDERMQFMYDIDGMFIKRFKQINCQTDIPSPSLLSIVKKRKSTSAHSSDSDNSSKDKSITSPLLD